MAKRRISPTKLTLDYLRKRGCVARVTERWIKTASGGIRRDIFGGDLMALAGEDLINIQATTAAHRASRLTKTLANPEVKSYLQTGNHFQLWTWKKDAKLNRWIPRVTSIILLDGRLTAKPFELLASVSRPSKAESIHTRCAQVPAAEAKRHKRSSGK